MPSAFILIRLGFWEIQLFPPPIYQGGDGGLSATLIRLLVKLHEIKRELLPVMFKEKESLDEKWRHPGDNSQPRN